MELHRDRNNIAPRQTGILRVIPAKDHILEHNGFPENCLYDFAQPTAKEKNPPS
jgi:hypothetical protein